MRHKWLICHSMIENSGKLSLYCNMNQHEGVYGIKLYISSIREIRFKSSLAKLRCSSHPLSIETGRHNNIQRQDRICNHCVSHNIFVIEDEFHFYYGVPFIFGNKANVFE